MVQIHNANLSDAAAFGVTASIRTLTSWPSPFELEGSKMLRDLSFLRPHEVLKFDLGVGPELFKDGKPATFEVDLEFESLEGDAFVFQNELKIESVLGHGNWVVYGVDDVARRLKEIADTLKHFNNNKRVQVDTFDSNDRNSERLLAEKRRKRALRARAKK